MGDKMSQKKKKNQPNKTAGNNQWTNSNAESLYDDKDQGNISGN